MKRMDTFRFPPPTPSDLGDREVPRDGSRLQGVRVALLVTGGIAAFKAPMIARALRRQGAQVTAFCSEEALRYVTQDAMEWSTTNPVVVRLSAHAEHLSDAAPFDAYLVAPATAATIARMACGLAEGVVGATLASAIGRMERGQARVLVAPTMHGSMHTSILVENLEKLHRIGVRVIPPRDAYGKHNLPDEATLVQEVCAAMEGASTKTTIKDPNHASRGSVQRP
jgi:phosphopantothenoylcysteine decarboxylase/phosphopantothenate--cysteine ligase